MSVTRPPVVRTIVRGLRIRCPACGVGHVFHRGVESGTGRVAGGWRLDRCPGHWIGGSEINVLGAFAAGAAVYVFSAQPFGLGLGLGNVAVTLATVATGVSSLAFYRTSRGVFLALDYLIDATAAAAAAPPRADLDRGPGPDAPAPTRHAARSRRRRGRVLSVTVTAAAWVRPLVRILHPPARCALPSYAHGVPVAQLDRAPVS